MVQTLMGSSFPGRTLSWSMIPADTGVNLSNASWRLMVDDTCSSAQIQTQRQAGKQVISSETSLAKVLKKDWTMTWNTTFEAEKKWKDFTQQMPYLTRATIIVANIYWLSRFLKYLRSGWLITLTQLFAGENPDMRPMLKGEKLLLN